MRVLDLSRVLADLGAEVVKIEEPGVGDEARRFSPFLHGVSTYFVSVNRGKKSIELNLKAEAGRRLMLDLVQKADILVENFRPGVMRRLGLDYETLRTKRPQLVYAACSGFGQTGPYAHRGAYDMIVQGVGGIMSITGEVGGSPVRVGTSIGDIAAGLFTTIGILAAAVLRNSCRRHCGDSGGVLVMRTPLGQALGLEGGPAGQDGCVDAGVRLIRCYVLEASMVMPSLYHRKNSAHHASACSRLSKRPG